MAPQKLGVRKKKRVCLQELIVSEKNKKRKKVLKKLRVFSFRNPGTVSIDCIASRMSSLLPSRESIEKLTMFLKF